MLQEERSAGPQLLCTLTLAARRKSPKTRSWRSVRGATVNKQRDVLLLKDTSPRHTKCNVLYTRVVRELTPLHRATVSVGRPGGSGSSDAVAGAEGRSDVLGQGSRAANQFTNQFAQRTVNENAFWLSHYKYASRQ